MELKFWTADDVADEDSAALASLSLAQLAAVNRWQEARTLATHTDSGAAHRLARLQDAEANRRNAAGSVERADP